MVYGTVLRGYGNTERFFIYDFLADALTYHVEAAHGK